MKFSIIIPFHNSGHTILNAIYSIIEQTFHDFELILINDSSGDDSKHIIERDIRIMSDSRIKVINLEKNSGVSHARNIAWQLAKGEFICFLDSDDAWRKDKLAVVYELLEGNKKINFLGHSYTLDDFHLISHYEPFNLKKISLFKILLSNYFQTSCVIIRNTIPFRFNERMSFCEDYDLWIRIAYNTDLYYFDIPLTKLSRPQLTRGGLSGNKLKMRRGEIKIYKSLYKLNFWFYPIIPFLIIYSFIKHIRRLVIFNLRNIL